MADAGVWTRMETKDGEPQPGFVTEISDLKANGMLEDGMITGPSGNKISFKMFVAQRDREGETTHWIYYRSGYTYTVIND